MKSLLTLFFVIIAAATAIAQNNFRPINYDSIRSAVNDPAKDTYYPRLLQRFNQFDTTLTLDDYRLLYFGYALQDNYAPYFNDGKEEINKLIKKRKYDEANEVTGNILAKTPIALATNFLKSFILMNMTENDSARHYAIRYKMLQDAILSTGDGLTCETAFKVIYVDDEYDLLQTFFDASIGMRVTKDPCDKFKISRSKNYSSSTIYFDYSANNLYLQRKYPNLK